MRRNFLQNPSPYDGWTLGQLKNEERRLAETIDDHIYFGRDPQQVQNLQTKLQEVRQVLRNANIQPISSAYPEVVLEDHIAFLQSEIRSLKSLERLAFDDGAFQKGSSYRAKRVDLEETIVKIAKLLNQLAVLRKNIVDAEAALDQSTERAAEISVALSELAPRLASRDLDIQQAAIRSQEKLLLDQRQVESLMYHHRHTINDAQMAADNLLQTIQHSLELVGYGINLARPVRPQPAIVFEDLIPPALQAPAAPAATGLPEELRRAFEPLSDDPTIRDLQLQLKKAVEDLTIAIEDREPPYILRKIEARVAQLHERITGAGGPQRRRYR